MLRSVFCATQALLRRSIKGFATPASFADALGFIFDQRAEAGV